MGFMVLFSNKGMKRIKITPDEFARLHEKKNKKNKMEYGPDPIWHEHVWDAYPEKGHVSSALYITYDLNLGRSGPKFADISVVTSCAGLSRNTITYDDMDKAHAYGMLNPVVGNFVSDYDKMSKKHGYSRYRYSKEPELSFAHSYNFAVTKISQQALARHVAKKDSPALFLKYAHNDTFYFAQPAETFVEQETGISICAPYRRVGDAINMNQLISVIKDPRKPCYSEKTMLAYARTLEDMIGSNERIVNPEGILHVVESKVNDPRYKTTMGQAFSKLSIKLG